MIQAAHHSPALGAAPSERLAHSLSFSPNDLAFLLDDTNRWQLKVDCPDDDCGDALAQAVAAAPKALEWHVRRIHHAYRRRAQDELYAALLDLFTVLNGRGSALQSRMLAGTRKMLGADEAAALGRIVREGRLPPERELPRAPGSRLSQGIEGFLDLVTVGASVGPVARDSLLEAREYIEYCQLEPARLLLETAIIENPQRADLHLELLSLYRATRDQANFGRMREQLLQLMDPLPAGWADMSAPIETGEQS